MKNIAILGSTGSIGVKTLEVVSEFPDKFRVVGLSANSNIDLLERQIKRFNPEIVAVKDEARSKQLEEKIVPSRVKIYSGQEGLNEFVRQKDVDLVVVAISGSSALIPILESIENNKIIALANKEALVMAGQVIMNRAKAKSISIIPIDSEHSAIFQCLSGQNRDYLRKIYLTSSGGPLNEIPIEDLKFILPQQALNHPKWKMGRKISVDSATLMNKGLEVIEARWFFDIDVNNIKVLIHKEAIIHSMVEFVDGTVLAQLAITDMRLPIQYALTYPQRWPTPLPRLDFLKVSKLTFDLPDLAKFPCLSLAYRVACEGGSFPCVLSVANEEAVEAFLNNQISIDEIHKIIEKVLAKHKRIDNPTLRDILNVEIWAREEAKKAISMLKFAVRSEKL